MNTHPRICKNLTFGIPVRIDSEERMSNLLTVIKYLAVLRCPIIVLEAGEQPHISGISHMNNVEYRFMEDTKDIFHKTHYINELFQMSQTEIVSIWDTDVLVDYNQIFEALQMIQDGATISYPYDGRFVMLSEQLSIQTRHKLDFERLRNLKLKSFLGRKLCGGAYLVHKQRYLQCGGENERFVGWGPEDAERLHRVTILGYGVFHIPDGELFHLYHPRVEYSTYSPKENTRCMREEFVKICCMSPSELKSYMSK